MGCSTIFQPSRKDSSRVQTSPLLFMGTATWTKIASVPQPSNRAASRISSGMARNPWAMRNVPRGRKTAGRINAQLVSSRASPSRTK